MAWTEDTAALFQAARDGRTDDVRTLLALGLADPRANCSAVLCQAAVRGRTHVIEALLADGRADPSAYESSALVHAAMHAHSRIIQLLLEDGRADPRAIFSRRRVSFGWYADPHEALKNGHALIASVMRWHRRRAWLLAAA